MGVWQITLFASGGCGAVVLVGVEFFLPSAGEWYGPRLWQYYLGLPVRVFLSVREGDSLFHVWQWEAGCWCCEGRKKVCCDVVCVCVVNVAVEVSSVVACFRLFLRRCRRIWRAVLALSERVASHGSRWPGDAGRLANTVARCLLGNRTAIRNTFQHMQLCYKQYKNNSSEAKVQDFAC